MTTSPRITLAVALLALLGGLGPLSAQEAPHDDAPPQATLPKRSPADEAAYQASLRKLLDAHNAERKAQGLEPLAWSDVLHRAAESHARDMAEHGEMRHEGSDGSEPADRVRQAGYKYRTTGENVAAGQTTIAEVVSGWMNSPPHRKNILGDFTEMGPARVVAEDGRPYWSVSFGTPFPPLDPAKDAAELVEAIHAAREKAGKPAVVVDPRLTKVAEAAAKEAASAGEQAADPSSQEFARRLGDEGYRIRALYASVARAGRGGAVLVEQMITKSPGQGLTGDYRHVGVGVAEDPEGVPVRVVLMAKPR